MCETCMECYRLPNEIAVGDFEVTLSDQRAFVAEKPIVRQWCIYDTFDWRLFARSLMLCRFGSEFVLYPFAGGGSLRCDVGACKSAFAGDLPEGDLRHTLEPVLKARALVEMARVYIEETTYRILNVDEKTVVRAVYSALRKAPEVTSPTISTYVYVQPVRGYAGHASRLAEALALGTEISSPQEAVYYDALAAAGRSPNSYSAKLRLKLDADQRVDEATKVIMHLLLEVMRANEDGIRNDIDTEFLHDYRVAIRKTRSALSQIKNVFPDDVTTHFKHEFRQLGQRTNQLRDLDVYLLAEPEYRAMLPDALQDSVTPLFEHLRSQRSEALGDVINGLDLEGYELTLLEWESFLTESIAPSAAGVNAGVPIIDLARQQIYRRYRRIIKRGNRLLKRTEDVKLHALRIECKKLRYLLEFFANLFPSKKVNRLIRQLKRLQDNLGDFTDLSVQQEHLLTVAGELPIEDPQTRRALVATSVLVDALASKQKEVKGDFAKTFSKFASPANQKAYHKLFDHEVTRRTL
jgi:CHAD domain-containing protein